MEEMGKVRTGEKGDREGEEEDTGMEKVKVWE